MIKFKQVSNNGGNSASHQRSGYRRSGYQRSGYQKSGYKRYIKRNI